VKDELWQREDAKSGTNSKVVKLSGRPSYDRQDLDVCCSTPPQADAEVIRTSDQVSGKTARDPACSHVAEVKTEN